MVKAAKEGESETGVAAPDHHMICHDRLWIMKMKG